MLELGHPVRQDCLAHSIQFAIFSPDCCNRVRLIDPSLNVELTDHQVVLLGGMMDGYPRGLRGPSLEDSVLTMAVAERQLAFGIHLFAHLNILLSGICMAGLRDSGASDPD